MRREHIVDGWWTLPGAPVPALRLARHQERRRRHRVWLPNAAQTLLDGVGRDAGRCLPVRVRRSSADDPGHAGRSAPSLGVERATPHDLRRTHGTTITVAGFWPRGDEPRCRTTRRAASARCTTGIGYADENKRIMEAVASRILSLATGEAETGNVTPLRGARFKTAKMNRLKLLGSGL